MPNNRLHPILAALILATLACSLPFQLISQTPTPEPDDSIAIFAAATFSQLTVVASSHTPTFTASASQTPTNTATPPPTETLTPTASPTVTLPPYTDTPEGATPSTTPSLTPTLTPLRTSTPISNLSATNTPTAARTNEPAPCNRAAFVRDITYGDGAVIDPGKAFTKVWRLRNAGSCTWTDRYEVVFAGGDRMSGQSTSPLPDVVAPGETVDIAIELIAPTAPGEYRGLWEISDGSRTFGLGSDADDPFWVEIRVPDIEADSPGMIYNFAVQYCSAEWESSTADSVACGGPQNERNGFVAYLSRPELEHRTENEPALWTQPPDRDEAWIRGAYPPIEIESGARFVADIGCLADNEECDVRFQLNYRIDNGEMKRLGQWEETFDGQITRINLDLSSLAGNEVEFVLTVLTNGNPIEDAAFWLMPRIVRE